MTPPVTIPIEAGWRPRSPGELLGVLDGLTAVKPEGRRLRVCGGPGCLAAGSGRVLEALANEAGRASTPDAVGQTGCLGLCQRGPLVLGEPDGSLYERVEPADAPELAAEALVKGAFVERLLDHEGRRPGELSFYKPQTRLIMRRLGTTSPGDLGDHLRSGGYRALAKALGGLSPDEVVSMISASGLRGRGGAGFPAGRKWAACRAARGPVKYVLANGDEGDPGAFMNRALMEGDPLAVIEGMTIGAYAVGASLGIIYVRHEYPLSVERLRAAIKAAEAMGLLGGSILGTGISFKLEVVEGGGAFVCGESTALMASIEGREGTPRVKYVRSTERGLWDRPTLLQNVETWANVPLIIERGPERFRSVGTRANPGTKIFSLVGSVRRSGLAEVPLGTSVRTLVEDIGGGARPGRTIKAVQTGGPSGGCLPEKDLDLPLDFDSLPAAGTIMGSGGLIVIDDLGCAVDIARYYTAFLASESCGKCLPCREGLPALTGLLDDLRAGRGRDGHAALLKRMAGSLAKSALCGLGRGAANPILSTLRHFRDEYLEHERGFCRSGRCQGLFEAAIDPERCAGCGACQRVCPAAAVSGDEGAPRQIDPGACEGCGACLSACRHGAVSARERGARA